MADLNIGNSSASVVVNAKHNGSVIPQINNTYDLGTSTLKWKNIYGSTFVGSLNGNAATATKATQDSANQQINTTYIKGLSASGRTITYTKGDGTTGTITTQDSNTTYSAGTGLALSGTKFSIDSTVITKDSMLQTTNPFGGSSLYISKIDNAFYTAQKRWTVTGSFTGSSSGTYSISELSALFDGNYETVLVVPKGCIAKIRITFDTNETGTYGGAKVFPGYPYGYAYISYYYNATPSTPSKMRMYCNYEPHVIGEHEYTMSTFNGSYSSPGASSGNSAVVEYVRQPNYAMSYIEFEINGATNYDVRITQIEMRLERPDSSKTPFLSKYGSETLYYPLTAPQFNGNLSGNALTATKATQDSAGQQINTTYIKGLSVSGKTITYTKGDGTTGTITTQDNNTTYSAGAGLTLSGTQFKHSNSVTAATAQGDASKTLTFGGTFTIPTITYDAQGHITGKGTTTMTMPANPNTDTHWTTGITAGATGTTSNSATTNGNTFIKIKDNSTHRGQIKLVGSGATSVSSDANGIITISSTDNNTTYGSMSVSEGTTGTATTNRVLTAANLKGIINAHAPTKTGGGASGTWGINISGSSKNISYPAQLTTDDAIDAFNTGNMFQVSTWTNTSSPGVSNGIIINAGWTNATYGAQIAIDDDPTYFMALRQKGGGGWNAWKRIPMGDGTGASGTWGISISGNAATASKVNNKLTVGSKSYDGSAAVTIEASDLGLASAMLFLGTTTTAITDGATTNPVVLGGSNKTVTAGNVVLYGSKEFVWTGRAWEELGNEGSYKIVQAAVADPSASGTSNTFIATISQDTNGKITATKKTVAVTNSAPTLAWGATSTIGTVAGTNLQVKMPANPNTDTKVTQTAINAADYTNWRPLIWGSSNSETEGFTPSTVTDGVYTAQTLSCQPSTGTIRATTFKGSLSGNAATATKLATARTIRTNLASTSAASFDGSGNITPGVTGTLPIANGGTGATTASAARNNLGAQSKVLYGSSAPSDSTGSNGDMYIALESGDFKKDIVDLIYPVGSIYISMNSTNPSTLFGGTWEAFGQGRVLIGVGTGNDGSTSLSFPAGFTGGEYKHYLAKSEIPSHSHSFSGATAANSRSHTHSYTKAAGVQGHKLTEAEIPAHTHAVPTPGYYAALSTPNTGFGAFAVVNPPIDKKDGYQTGSIGGNGSHNHGLRTSSATSGSESQNHTHTFSGTTDQNTDGGESHNNIQPYIGVYMWKRTA